MLCNQRCIYILLYTWLADHHKKLSTVTVIVLHFIAAHLVYFKIVSLKYYQIYLPPILCLY